MAYNDREAGNGLGAKENEMLRQLNNEYRAGRFADRYTDNEEYLKTEDGSVQIDIGTLSDGEFKTLFDSYLAASNMDVADMSDSAYRSLQQNIVKLQKKSGATLLAGDELEKRFEDAEQAVFVPEEDAEGASTMEIAVPARADDFADDGEEDFGETTEFIMHDSQMFDAPAKNTVPVTASQEEEEAEADEADEEEKSEAEKVKERRMSIFSKLKAIMRAAETEEISVGLESDAEAEAFEYDENADEPATEEFIIPSFVSENAENALGTAEEETTPEEEMLENYVEDTSEIAIYTPDFDVTDAAEETGETEISEVTDETEISEVTEVSEVTEAEATGEIPEVTDFEEDDEIIPEENAQYIPDEGGEEEDELYGDETVPFTEEALDPQREAEIIDALVADNANDGEDATQRIFGDFSVDSEADEEAEEEPEEKAEEKPAEKPEEKAEEKPAKKEEKPEEEPDDDNEYVSFEQNIGIISEYKKKYMSVRTRMGVGIAIAVILLIIENIGIFGIKLPGFLCTTAVLVPLEWTLLFIDAFLVCPSLFTAAKNFFKFRFEPATVTLLAFIAATCTTFAAIFAEGEIRFFNFPFALCVLFNLISIFLSLHKEFLEFRIISARKKKKHAVVRMSEEESSAEAQEFTSDISTKSQFYRVDEADFVGGYFTQKRKASVMNKRLRVIVPLMLLAACAMGLINAFVQEATVYESIAFGYLSFVICAPLAVFFVNELPLYLSSVKAHENDSAILGDSVPEIIENMSVLAFSDSDVFKADGVRIKGVKVIGNNRIDHIIYYASSLFDMVGGPLAKVFKQASLESVHPENAEVRVITSKGIDAVIDGKHIVAGTEKFMAAQRLHPAYEEGDENWDGQTTRRILYLSCDEEIIAKFYVEYSINPEFVNLVKKLDESGICVSVRTNDPCVDVDLFYKNNLDPVKYHLCVVKGKNKIGTKRKTSVKNSSIVTNGSIKSLVKTVLLCDRLANVMKTNFVVKLVSALAGLAIMGILLFMNIALCGSWVWSLFFGLYQFAWLVPVYIISKIYI